MNKQSGVTEAEIARNEFYDNLKIAAKVNLLSMGLDEERAEHFSEYICLFIALEFGGVTLSIPKDEQYFREIRNRLIVNDYNMGLSFKTLSRIYRMHDRSIRRIVEDE